MVENSHRVLSIILFMQTKPFAWKPESTKYLKKKKKDNCDFTSHNFDFSETQLEQPEHISLTNYCFVFVKPTFGSNHRIKTCAKKSLNLKFLKVIKMYCNNLQSNWKCNEILSPFDTHSLLFNLNTQRIWRGLAT